MSCNEFALETFRFLAQKLAGNPDYMAHALAVYQKEQGLDEEGVARKLGALPEMIVRLALCKRPKASSEDFEDRISELSDFALIDEAILLEVLHPVGGFAEEDVKAHTREKHKFRLPQTLSSLLAAIGNRVSAPAIGLRLAFLISTVLVVCLIGALAWRELTRVPGNGPAIDDHATLTQPSADLSTIPLDVPAAAKAFPPVVATDEAAHTGISSEKPALIARVTVKLDFERAALVRDGDYAGDQKIMRISPVRTRFVLTLSEGSPRGAYQVSMVDGYGKPLIARAGSSLDGKILKTVIDLEGLRGKYRLCVSRRDEAPDCYPVLVAEPGKRATAGIR